MGRISHIVSETGVEVGLLKVTQQILVVCLLFVFLGCSRSNGKNLNKQLTLTHSFACDSYPPLILLVFNNALYVLNVETEVGVIKYDFNGEKLFTFGGKGEGPCEFIFPNNIYFDLQENLIGITDFVLQRTTFIDTLGNFIKIQKFDDSGKTPMFAGIINVNKSVVEASTLPSSLENSNSPLSMTYQIKMIEKNHVSKLIMKRTYPINRDISKNTIKMVNANEELIFFAEWEPKISDYKIEIFNHQGENYICKPKYIPSKVQSMNVFSASRKYLFINAKISDKRMYLVYDLEGYYKGFLELRNVEIWKIKDEKLFVITEEQDRTLLKIFEIDF